MPPRMEVAPVFCLTVYPKARVCLEGADEGQKRRCHHQNDDLYLHLRDSFFIFVMLQ